MSANQGNGQNGSFGGKGRGRAERNGFKNVRVLPENEDIKAFKETARDIIKRFIRSGNTSETLDPMSRDKRKIMHDLASSKGLITKSNGKEPNRCLTISLRNNVLTSASLTLTGSIAPHPKAMEAVNSFFVDNPVRSIDMEHFLLERHARMYVPRSGSSRMKSGIPPKSNVSPAIQKCKNDLPATKYREHVLKAITNNHVVIISGGTGCGKTTQVPQFILENAAEKKVPVRIMVTQPRRIAAISIAERVAKERGERLGDTVGFQVRLDSKQSDKTLLTYCTTGVLLRMLTADPIASGITHIIMDEIHEREINTDYLLIALRECLHKRRDLKLILMSATIEGNMALFGEYFRKQDVETIKIESKLFDVKTFYLDQILAMCGYEPPENQAFFAPFSFNPDDWEDELIAIKAPTPTAPPILSQPPVQQFIQPPPQTTIQAPINPMMMMNTAAQHIPVMSANVTDPWHSPYYDQPQQYFDPSTGQYSFVEQNRSFYYEGNDSIVNDSGEWVSGGYQTLQGEFIDSSTMNQFMEVMGDPSIRPMSIEFRPTSPHSVFVNGIRYTTNEDQPVEKLAEQMEMRESMPDCTVVLRCTHPVKQKPLLPPPIVAPTTPLTPEPVLTASSTKSGLGRLVIHDGFGFGEKHGSAELLEKKFRNDMKTILGNRPVYYHPSINKIVDATDFEKLRFSELYQMFYGVDFKSTLDHHLLDTVVKYLADSPIFGSILVFLPGYDDIQEMMGRISSWRNKLTNFKNVLVIPLHSQMNSVDHSEVFRPVEQGTRKIILATNIAEASITIEDVIFVVDTGKAKEKAYNHESKLHTLTVTPISKSNAKQRAGRAGRVANGYCIRLYSEREFEEMPETQMAEMKRAAIYDVTLHAKLFAPNNMKIVDFLSLAPEPPSNEAIAQSVQFLEQVGAFYSQRKYENRNNEEEEEVADMSEEEERDPDLTDLGRLMARLPLDPQLSRMLLFGLALKCLTPIINLVAMLANRDPYTLTTTDNREAQAHMKSITARNDFSDHLVLIRLCSNYCSKYNYAQQNAYCREHFLNANTMRMACGTRRQLLTELLRAKLIYISPDRDVMSVLVDKNYNKNADCWPMVQAAIAAGCYPSVGISSADSRLKKVQTFNQRSACLHPSSILKKQVQKMTRSTKDPTLEYVAFQELCQSPDYQLMMKMVTAIPSITALLFTGPIRMSEQDIKDHNLATDGEKKENDGAEKEEEENVPFGFDWGYFELDTWYSVRAEQKILSQFLRLRYKFMHFFLCGIYDPPKFGQDTPTIETRMLEVIRELLESEHRRFNFSPVTMPDVHLKEFPRYVPTGERPQTQHHSKNKSANKAIHQKQSTSGAPQRPQFQSTPVQIQAQPSSFVQQPPVPRMFHGAAPSLPVKFISLPAASNNVGPPQPQTSTNLNNLNNSFHGYQNQSFNIPSYGPPNFLNNTYAGGHPTGPQTPLHAPMNIGMNNSGSMFHTTAPNLAPTMVPRQLNRYRPAGIAARGGRGGSNNGRGGMHKNYQNGSRPQQNN